MFSKLQQASVLRLSRQKEKNNLHGMLEARLPLELIYKIIDDYGRELLEDNAHDLRALAYTCRAIAAYCRPHILHTVTLYGIQTTIPSASSLGSTTRPDGFARLLGAYPSVAQQVKTLRIVIVHPYPSKEDRLLKKIGIDRQRSAIKPWVTLLGATYAQLTNQGELGIHVSNPPSILLKRSQDDGRIGCPWVGRRRASVERGLAVLAEEFEALLHLR